MKLNFEILYDPKVTCSGDLMELLNSLDKRDYFGVPNASQMVRALMRIDVQEKPDASRAVLQECRGRTQHLAAGALLYRILELIEVEPVMDERPCIDEMVEIMEVAYNNKNAGKMRAFTPLVALGMLQFMEFRKSPNIQYFADSILNSKSSLAWNLLCHAVEQKDIDLHPMYAMVREAIERKADFKSWMVKTVPPHARKHGYRNTGYREILEVMPKADRGEALGDALGL